MNGGRRARAEPGAGGARRPIASRSPPVLFLSPHQSSPGSAFATSVTYAFVFQARVLQGSRFQLWAAPLAQQLWPLHSHLRLTAALLGSLSKLLGDRTAPLPARAAISSAPRAAASPASAWWERCSADRSICSATPSRGDRPHQPPVCCRRTARCSSQPPAAAVAAAERRSTQARASPVPFLGNSVPGAACRNASACRNARRRNLKLPPHPLPPL